MTDEQARAHLDAMIAELTARPDAQTDAVQAAIARAEVLREYLFNDGFRSQLADVTFEQTYNQ
jgi:hypothetical protein